MAKTEELKQSGIATKEGNQPVTILDDFGHVDTDPVHISKSKKEHIIWKHNGKNRIAIQFKNESPFFSNWFEATPNGGCDSGEQRPEIRVGQRFPYTVGQNDPVVIIDP